MALAAWLFAAGVTAQRWYVGVKGGVPLSENDLRGAVFSRPVGGGPSRLLVRPYTAGPSVEVGLPLWGLGVEVDALYKRSTEEQRFFFNEYIGFIDRAGWNVWEVPMLIRRQWAVGKVAPFASIGGVIRLEAGGRSGSREQFVSTPGQVNSTVQRYTSAGVGTVQGGWVAGGGVRFGIWRGLKVTPELRYTRYTSPRGLPTENQLEFLVGFGIASPR